MPRLVYPFTLVGAAAGWLSAELLDNPVAGVTPSHAGALAAVCSGAVGAAVGIFLQRRSAPREAFVPVGGMWLQVAIAVLLGGALSGGVTGGLAFGNDRGVSSGLAAGLAAGAAFLPVCALVVAAARRAARARLGSLVAATDRRELWALMLAALAVTTAAGLPDAMAGQAPITAIALASLSLAIVAALCASDMLAARAVRRAAIAAGTMDPFTRGAEAEGSLPSVDLGLGDEVRAEVQRSAAAYRGRDRATSLLVGSLDEARAAVRQALGRKLAAFAVAAAALGAHGLAARPRARILYHEILCERGHGIECGIAAAKLRELGEPDDLARAVILGTHACESFKPPDVQGCKAAAEAAELDEARTDRAARQHLRERACLAGDAGSCRVVARMIQGDGWRVAAVLQRACEVGDMASCVGAVRAREDARLHEPNP